MVLERKKFLLQRKVGTKDLLHHDGSFHAIGNLRLLLKFARLQQTCPEVCR